MKKKFLPLGKISPEKIERAIQHCKTAGIDVRGAFMLGNIGDTVATMDSTIKYAIALEIKYAIFNITTPYPGTTLYEEAKSQGFLKHQNWKLYDLAHAVMDLPALSADTVQKHYKISYRKFYFRPRYFLRLLFGFRSSTEFLGYIKAFFGILALVGNRLFFRNSTAEQTLTNSSSRH